MCGRRITLLVRRHLTTQVGLLNRHVVLTIRNLTAHAPRLRSLMRIITIKRTVFTRERAKTSTSRRSIRQFAQDFFATENHLEFVVEALLFAVLLIISAWPIVAAASAISDLLQTGTS